MDNKQEYIEEIKSINKIMEKSSRFLSLSGLSGIFAGSAAIAGGILAHFAVMKYKTSFIEEIFINLSSKNTGTMRTILIIDAILVLLLALGGALYFSYKKSLRQGLKIWTPISKRLLLNFLVPLATGGLFIIILYTQNLWQLIVPSMLIFYGLALVNAGKFTYSEVFYLGLAEIVTGLISAIFPELAILFWCFGFGLIHIAYGFFMYRKYEI
jgi:hypothetical protein